MKKLIILLILILSACSNEPISYKKVEGEIVDKRTTNIKYTNYYLDISYPLAENNKYGISDIAVEKEFYDEVKIKEKVIIYIADDEIEKVVKVEPN